MLLQDAPDMVELDAADVEAVWGLREPCLAGSQYGAPLCFHEQACLFPGASNTLCQQPSRHVAKQICMANRSYNAAVCH